MFKVVHKDTGTVKTVYHTAGVYFLFWEEERGWYIDLIENYIPVAGE